MIANDSFPLRHLHRMHLIFSGNLPDRFDAHQRFQSNFGFEGTRVPLPLSSFAHGSAVLSSPAEPEKSNLGYCPKFAVHFFLPARSVRLLSAASPNNLVPCAQSGYDVTLQLSSD